MSVLGESYGDDCTINAPASMMVNREVWRSSECHIAAIAHVVRGRSLLSALLPTHGRDKELGRSCLWWSCGLLDHILLSLRT